MIWKINDYQEKNLNSNETLKRKIDVFESQPQVFSKPSSKIKRVEVFGLILKDFKRKSW